MFENQLIVRKKAVMGRSKPPLSVLGEDEPDRKEERRERKVLIVQLDD